MKEIIVGVLLGIGVLSVLLSCIGLLAMRTAMDRLHFTAPAGTIAPVLFAAAVLVEEPLSSAAVKAVLVALLIIVTTPSLSHATARAARIREHGRFKLLPEEQPDEERLQ